MHRPMHTACCGAGAGGKESRNKMETEMEGKGSGTGRFGGGEWGAWGRWGSVGQMRECWADGGVLGRVQVWVQGRLVGVQQQKVGQQE
ncbi:hypothetical protein CVT25_005396, partial [Psilocybe cyanescens]